ncbi:MAG TPA: hypothetical protein VM238_16990 [Phycisphaerae bacterium]|nr:hypothetical protein [Phycisphaerae bacterium]
MPMPTFLDVIKLNGGDREVGLIDEASKAVPEVRLGGARTIRGLNYKTNVRTAVPVVGFRKANEGTPVAGSTFEQRLIECYLMNPPFECDKAVADAHEDGPAVYLATQALGITEGAFQALGRAFFYGSHATFGKADAFPGLLQAYDAVNLFVDAGGTTDNVATSVWAVRWGVQDVRWVLGEGGRAEVTDPVEVRLVDGSGNPYMAYHQELYLRPGVQVGSVYSVGRIKKITTDATKGLTDDLIDALMAMFPAGRPPNAIFMSRRSRQQWKDSRTATSPTGAPAPWPDTVDGPEGQIPVLTTDSISNIETLVL